jgi:hypothetical protein
MDSDLEAFPADGSNAAKEVGMELMVQQGTGIPGIYGLASSRHFFGEE